MRNYDGIQFSEFRQTFDDKFNQMHDELTDTYYQYWRQGKSKSFHGYDVLPTLEENKAQFDKLHGLIFLLYDFEFHETNSKLPLAKRIPEEIYNYKYDKDGNLVDSKSNEAQAKIEILKSEGYELVV